MKILQVMAGGEHGGAETAYVDITIAMHEAGFEVEAVTRPNDVRVPALAKAGIKVHTLPFGGPVDVFTTWKLSRIIKKFEPSIVQTWMTRATQKTLNWKVLKTPKPYLVVARLGGYYKIKNFWSADYFVANTPELKQHIMNGGIAEDHTRMITNFAPREVADTIVKKSDLDTPENAPVLLALGRLHKNKAHDILIRAAALLPGVYVWIAGEGEDREALEKLAADLGISERVKFLGWRTDRAALMQACDICVFVSRVEPFGNVYVQAWQSRVPVIVSDASGMKQFCRPDEDCVMVPIENPEATASAVRRVLADTALAEMIVTNGYRRFEEEFTKERCVAAYNDFYIEILTREGIL